MNESQEWQQAKAQFPIGCRVSGAVVRHCAFGIFVDLNGVQGLILIVEFLDGGRMTADRYPPVGSVVEAVVISHAGGPQNQIRLSLRPSVLGDAN